MTTPASQPTQYGMGTNVVTKPPAPMAPLGPTLEAPAGCPPGLEYLTQLDQILVQEQRKRCSSYINYQIKDALGQEIYSTTVNYNVQCGPVAHISDNTGQEVMRVVLQNTFCYNSCCDLYQLCPEYCCCENCCRNFFLNATVEAPPGQPIGHVRLRESICRAFFDIFDVNLKPLLRIQSPNLWCSNCNCDIDLSVISLDGSREVGKFSKEWSGCMNEFSFKGNDLSVTFPRDLDVKVKATLFGVLFVG